MSSHLVNPFLKELNCKSVNCNVPQVNCMCELFHDVNFNHCSSFIFYQLFCSRSEPGSPAVSGQHRSWGSVRGHLCPQHQQWLLQAALWLCKRTGNSQRMSCCSALSWEVTWRCQQLQAKPLQSVAVCWLFSAQKLHIQRGVPRAFWGSQFLLNQVSVEKVSNAEYSKGFI